MNTLRDYVNWGIAHSDNVGKAEGVPLVMEKCKLNKKMKQLEVYGESVQNGTPTPEAPVWVESVGQACIRNWFEKNMFLRVEDYNAATNYSFYKAKYIEGLKPNTKYNVVIERLNGTKPMSAKCTVLLSGGVFLPTANNFTTIGHASSKDETNNSPHTSDASGRLTIGISTSVTKEQLDLLWENTNVYLYEDGDTKTVYKIPLLLDGKIAQNLYLNKPLRKIGSYADYIDFKNKKVVRVIESKILDGGENYIKMPASPHPYTFVVLGGYGTGIDDVCLCNKLQFQANFSYTREGINTFRIFNSNTSGSSLRAGFRIYKDGESVTEVSEVSSLVAKKYTEGNPIIFYYALSSAIEEPIECKLPSLTSKTSVIEIGTSVLPSNIKGKYIKR